MDDTQRIMAWKGLQEGGVISKDLMRGRIVNVTMPRDEETRIALENALASPEMQPKVQLRAMQKSYKQDDWELMIVGTPLEQVHQQEVAWREQKAQEAEAEKAQRAENKRQKEMEAMMASMPGFGMPPGGEQMPPGMMPLPDMQDPMMGGLPPDMGMMNPGGMPPQGPEMGGFPPGMGMPPPSMDPSMMDPNMQPPGMPPGVMPAEMTGQFTPEGLNMGQGAPPGMFQDITGQPPLDETDMMNRLSGLPRQ
jgi:hypothetical protein